MGTSLGDARLFIGRANIPCVHAYDNAVNLCLLGVLTTEIVRSIILDPADRQMRYRLSFRQSQMQKGPVTNTGHEPWENSRGRTRTRDTAL